MSIILSQAISLLYLIFKDFHNYKMDRGGGGGGTTRPLPRDGGAEELREDPTVGPHPKVWTIDRE